MKTKVTVMAVPPAQVVNGQRQPVKPVPLLPQPVDEVEGKHGSDQAKKNAVKAMEDAGYRVRTTSFTKDEILVYVDQEKPKAREPRSATPRRVLPR